MTGDETCTGDVQLGKYHELKYVQAGSQILQVKNLQALVSSCSQPFEEERAGSMPVSNRNVFRSKGKQTAFKKGFSDSQIYINKAQIVVKTQGSKIL